MRSIHYALLLLLCLIFPSISVRAQQSPDRPRYAISVTQGERALGRIVLELYPDVAPLTVRNFDSLVGIGFYNGTAIHRVIPNSIIQGGDPNSRDQPEETWGFGDPDQRTIPAEFSNLSHTRGIISMARRGNDTNSATSQFFICVGNRKDLDHKYTIFGRVVEGMNVVDTITHTEIGDNDRPVEKVEMTITKLEATGRVGNPGLISSGITASAAPNPSTDHLSISYNLPDAGYTLLAVYDAMGRRVRVLANEVQEAGPHALSCDMSALPAGMYAWQLRVNGEFISGILIKNQ